MARNGVRIELEEASRKNLEKNMDIIKKKYPLFAMDFVTKLLFDMKFLAQQKLKADSHIVTSRLRNSIFVKMKDPKRERVAGNNKKYSDDEGNVFDADLTTVKLEDNEGAFGTNVEYANKIELMYDSFIYWASKHVDVRKRVSQLVKELKEIRFVR